MEAWATGGGKEELDGLIRLRDKLLDRAYVREGMTLLDVGAGDGLIAFGALEKLGPTGKVIVSDISESLLKHARERRWCLPTVQES